MLDRTVAPPSKEIKSLQISGLQYQSLKNGIPLYYFSDTSLKVVKIEVHFEAGRWNEKVLGSSLFLSKLLSEGTRFKTSSQINQVLESLGAFFDCSAGADFFSVNIYAMTSNILEVLEILNEMLTENQVSDSELEKLRSIQLSQHKINLEKTSYLASREFRSSLFGSDHPYGSSLSETDISKIESKDISGFYSNELMKSSCTIIASGNVSETVLAGIDNYFGRLAVHSDAVQKNFSLNSGKRKIVNDRKDAVQSTIMVGRIMPGRDFELTHKISVVNQIVGGYFGSRLMKNLREDKGYTYGIHSRVNHMQNASYLSISGDVIKDSREQAMDEIRKELNTLSERRVGEEELDLVRNFSLGSLLSSVDSVFSIALLFKLVHFSGLDLDYYQARIEAIKNISSDDILELSRAYFDPKDLHETTVG